MAAEETSVSEGPNFLDATEVSLSEVPLRLYLVATSPGTSPRTGTAKIGTDPNAPQTYVAGALLMNGARVAEIYNQYVVLERAGNRFRLELWKGGANPSQAREETASELEWVGASASKPSTPKLAVDRLSEVLRMSPEFEDEILVGMRIFPGKKSHVFSALRLHSGDIVTAVDGVPILNAGMANDMFVPLTEGTRIVLSITRGAEKLMVDLDSSVVTSDFETPSYAFQTPPATR